MSSKWTSNTLTGDDKAGVQALGDQFVVLLLYGKNSFGDRIYSYLKITISDLQRLKSAIQAGNGFNPSDYGTVIAAGKGEPPDETRAEIARMYEVLDSVTQTPVTQSAIPEEKKEWDEY